MQLKTPIITQNSNIKYQLENVPGAAGFLSRVVNSAGQPIWPKEMIVAAKKNITELSLDEWTPPSGTMIPGPHVLIIIALPPEGSNDTESLESRKDFMLEQVDIDAILKGNDAWYRNTVRGIRSQLARLEKQIASGTIKQGSPIAIKFQEIETALTKKASSDELRLAKTELEALIKKMPSQEGQNQMEDRLNKAIRALGERIGTGTPGNQPPGNQPADRNAPANRSEPVIVNNHIPAAAAVSPASSPGYAWLGFAILLALFVIGFIVWWLGSRSSSHADSGSVVTQALANYDKAAELRHREEMQLEQARRDRLDLAVMQHLPAMTEIISSNGCTIRTSGAMVGNAIVFGNVEDANLAAVVGSSNVCVGGDAPSPHPTMTHEHVVRMVPPPRPIVVRPPVMRGPVCGERVCHPNCVLRGRPHSQCTGPGGVILRIPDPFEFQREIERDLRNRQHRHPK